MKKILTMALILTLSLSFCAIQAMAADDDGIIYDVNFDGGYNSVFKEDGWQNNTATDQTNANVEVVSASSEGFPSAPEGSAVSGSVLKLSGSDTLSKFDIKLPYAGYTYNNDKLIIEYDYYTPGKETGNLVAFSSTLYAIQWVNSTYPYNSYYENATKNEDETYTLNNKASGNGFGTSLPAGWYHIICTIDHDNINEIEIANKNASAEGVSTFSLKNQATYNLTAINLSNNTEFINKTIIVNKDNFSYSNDIMLKNTNEKYGTTYIDNFKMYTRDKFGIKFCGLDEKTDVTIDTNTVDIVLTTALANDAALAGMVVTANGEAVDGSLYTAALSADKKTVSIAFANDLLYETEYKIDFSGVTDKDGQAIEYGDGKITFTTEDAPDVYISDITFKKGYGASAADVAEIAADGSMYSLYAKVHNSTDTEKPAVLLYAVYDSSNKLTGVMQTAKDISPNSAETLGVGLTIDATKAGGKLRTYLWDSALTMKPWHNAIPFNISQ